MEETYNITGIIISRHAWRENDSRVILYSRERGKLELVARGTKKIKSKLAGHLEPINLVDMMVIKGRQYDYVGTCLSADCFLSIKEDLDRSLIAGLATANLGKLIKDNEPEPEIYDLILDFFRALNNLKLGSDQSALLYDYFKMKILSQLGYSPELYDCIVCHAKILANNKTKFSDLDGGLICGKCHASGQGRELTISDDCIKLLRIVLKENIAKLMRIKLEKKLAVETALIIDSFWQAHS